MTDFRNKSALVTGGTSGIGRVTALELAKRGTNVVLTGRRDKEGKDVVAEIKRLGVRGAFVQGDVTDEAHVKNAVEAAAGLTGSLDFAFNNAGIELMGVPIADATPEQYRKVFDINVLGVVLSMKHELRAMTRAGKGAIVNNASIAGSIVMPGIGLYAATKHAVIGLTKAAALEAAKAGVRVNTVSPAAIETDMYDRFIAGPNEDQNRAQIAAMHPIGRTGKSGEIAAPVLFLLSDDASFITGHDLRVDGGFTAQ